MSSIIKKKVVDSDGTKIYFEEIKPTPDEIESNILSGKDYVTFLFSHDGGLQKGYLLFGAGYSNLAGAVVDKDRTIKKLTVCCKDASSFEVDLLVNAEKKITVEVSSERKKVFDSNITVKEADEISVYVDSASTVYELRVMVFCESLR